MTEADIIMALEEAIDQCHIAERYVEKWYSLGVPQEILQIRIDLNRLIYKMVHNGEEPQNAH